MDTQTYCLLGGPGSPYSLKLRAALRYRRLPHVWVVPQSYIGGGDSELARAGKNMIPNLRLPEDGTYWADTTPILYALEARHPGQRSLLPDDPADAFLAHLIDDFADELLVNVLFTYRWGFAADLEFCPRRQLSGWLGAMPTADFEKTVQVFRQRQVDNLNRMGPRDIVLPLYEHVYFELLAIIERLLTESRYFFGSRPSLGEIGLFGQLSQCAIDPTASQLMKQRAPRAFQWVQDLDDASGIDGEWRGPASPPPAALKDLLRLVAGIYLPFAAAHADALMRDATQVDTTIAGKRFAGAVNPYTARCLLWLKDEYAKLDAAARQRVNTLLDNADAVGLLKFAEGEAALVPPHVPV